MIPVPLLLMVDLDALRSEWREAAARIDALHDEAWTIQTAQHERQTEIWLEVQRLRARIKEIVATGVEFEAAV